MSNSAYTARIGLLPRVTALTDGATITPNSDTTDEATVTIAGNRAMAAPSGTPIDGQKIIFRITQGSGGNRTITWDPIYRFASGSAPILSTTAGKIDYLGMQYNLSLLTWDCIAYTLNL